VEATEIRVATKRGGTLERLPVAEGDTLPSGRELAQFDTIDERLALEAAQAELAGARAELSLRRAGPRPQEIAEARAEVGRIEAELAAAQRDLGRFQGLLDSGSGTAKSRDDALARRDQAAQARRAAEERLARLEAGSRRQEIELAEARVSGAEARIAQLEQGLRDATVLSPAAGVVTEKLVEEGEILPPGSTLVVLTDLTDVWLTAWIPEPDLGRVRLGQEARVTTDGGEERTGRLTYVSPRAEFTPKNVQTRDERIQLVYKVKIALPNDDGLFKPGMPAVAHLKAVAPEPGAGGEATGGAS
jgi:HlyD family secretion protein